MRSTLQNISQNKVLLNERTSTVLGGGKFRFGNQGSEKDDEVKGEGNSYTTFFRMLDPRLGRWLSIDPIIQEYQNPYCSMDNKPIFMNDVKGDKGESTHIDNKGKVIAVFNDGDNSVYQHGKNADGGTPTEYMIKKRTEKWGSTAHGKKIGETKYWDEFINPETKKAEGVIHKDEKWDKTIKDIHDYAVANLNLYQIAESSKLGKPLDIKSDKKLAPDGPMTGKKLDGNYATARSAGNYLAGMNGHHGTLAGQNITKTKYMMMAGALDKGLYSKKMAAAIVLGAVTPKQWPYPAPFYGEDKYSGRRILEGWNH